MLIQTLHKRYEVIHVRGAGHDADVLLCRDLWEEQERTYLLVAVKNPDLIHRCAPYFTAQADNRSFKDFIECFSRDGLFYIVFAWHAKPLFIDKFNEEFYFLPERLEIGKSLLSRILLLDMPPGILYEALQERNLLLDDAMQVGFNYILEDISSFNLFSMDRVQQELGRIFRLILRRELATQVIEEASLFVGDLEQCVFRDYREIYEAFDRLYDLLTILQETGELNPKNFLFRSWEWLKKAFRFARPVLAGIVLATALGYLVYTLAYPTVRPGSPVLTIETIGTVQAE